MCWHEWEELVKHLDIQLACRRFEGCLSNNGRVLLDIECTTCLLLFATSGITGIPSPPKLDASLGCHLLNTSSCKWSRRCGPATTGGTFDPSDRQVGPQFVGTTTDVVGAWSGWWWVMLGFRRSTWSKHWRPLLFKRGPRFLLEKCLIVNASSCLWHPLATFIGSAIWQLIDMSRWQMVRGMAKMAQDEGLLLIDTAADIKKVRCQCWRSSTTVRQN